MSENERRPVRLDLSHISTIPAGKSGKAAKKQLANEKKARLNKIRRLAKADAGDGLLVMLTAPDPKLCRYIMKKLGHVIPFFVRAHSDGKCPEAAGEMSWLMCRCEERGMRTMWLDLTGAEKLDKKQVLCLVAGELIRVLEAPAPVRTPVVPEEVQVVAESEEEPVAAEPVVELQEATESEEEPVAAEPVVELQEAAESEEEPVAAGPAEEMQEAAESEEEPVAAEPAEELQAAAESEGVPVAAVEPTVTEEISTPEESGEAAPEKAEEEKPAPAKRRTRKAPPKAEGEAPAKPKRKRQPKAPLTVEETLARRRRQMGLEE